MLANVYQTISTKQLVQECAFHLNKPQGFPLVNDLKVRATPAMVRLTKGRFAQSPPSRYPFSRLV